PRGYEAYMLKSCLHDWNDAKAVEILRRCRDAMPEHGRALIVEIVLGPGRAVGHPHRLIDLERMVTLGGKERSEKEFATILDQAGLTLETVTPIAGSFFSVVEAAVRGGAAHKYHQQLPPYGGQEREQASHQTRRVKAQGLCAPKRSSTHAVQHDRARLPGSAYRAPVRRLARLLPSLSSGETSPYQKRWYAST